MSIIRPRFLPIAVCLAFGLAACGSDSKSTSTDKPVTTAADTTAAPDTTVAPETSATDAPDTSVDNSGGPVDVMLTDSTFGPILTDGEGNTLYMYAPDSAGVPTCTGGCASAWPPYLFNREVVVGDGLQADLFTTVPGNGATQLTYNGHPLYFFGGDSAPGDTNGQGSGGVWFVLDADGNQITA
jgi:predicted lipoprotein with Yx(FWY)xxD motif